MTDATPTRERLLPVEQRHRDAAADLAVARRECGSAFTAHIREGLEDDGLTVQAFARFERDHLATTDAREARQDRLRMFLEILSAAGGKDDAGDWQGNWINAFCADHEGREPDTFNLAIDMGLARSTHDVDSDTSTVWLTEEGRAFLATPSAHRPDAGEVERRCPASPDHADIKETIENAADDWQAQGYTSALAEVRDMANVGRALMEALPEGYQYMNCPSEIVADLQNERDEALAQPAPAVEEVELREAAKKVLDGLNDRIFDAMQEGRPVPVFDGIAELHAAILSARAALSPESRS